MPAGHHLRERRPGGQADTRRHSQESQAALGAVARVPGAPLARQCEGKDRDDLLFPGDGDGGHLRRPHPVSGWFAKAVTASGIPRATPHDLRHTAASLAVSAGANVKAVQKMLRHASAAMTLDVYADLFDDDLEAVATALDQARQKKLRPKCGHGRAMGTSHGGSADRVTDLQPARLTVDCAADLRF
jgi:integrase